MNIIEKIREASIGKSYKYLFVDLDTYKHVIDYYVETYYDATENDRRAIKNVMNNIKYENKLELYKAKVVRVLDKIEEGFYFV